MATRIYSMCLDVEGFMRNNRYPLGYDIFGHADGTPMTEPEALAYLTSQKAMGRKVIPCSSECGNPCKHADSGCTGFDYQGGGCAGRIKEE